MIMMLLLAHRRQSVRRHLPIGSPIDSLIGSKVLSTVPLRLPPPLTLAVAQIRLFAPQAVAQNRRFAVALVNPPNCPACPPKLRLNPTGRIIRL